MANVPAYTPLGQTDPCGDDSESAEIYYYAFPVASLKKQPRAILFREALDRYRPSSRRALSLSLSCFFPVGELLKHIASFFGFFLFDNFRSLALVCFRERVYKTRKKTDSVLLLAQSEGLLFFSYY